MPDDPTEDIRRKRLAEINADPLTRDELEAKYGQVWSTAELTRDFEIIGFRAPLVVVFRRGTRERGSFEFQHNPRYFFNYQPHGEK